MSDVKRWPDKTPTEKFVNGANWRALLGDAQLQAVAAEVLSGDVSVDDPEDTEIDGTVQRVWISGGTPGAQKVRCTATLSDARIYTQDFSFTVTE